MRKNFGAKPWTYPQPVFILAIYNEDGGQTSVPCSFFLWNDLQQLDCCLFDRSNRFLPIR